MPGTQPPFNKNWLCNEPWIKTNKSIRTQNREKSFRTDFLAYGVKWKVEAHREQ